MISVVAAFTLVGCDDAARTLEPRSSVPSLAVSPAGSYKVRDLGNLGGTVAVAFRINETGQVVGWATTPTGEQHGFRWTEDRGMVDLGMLPGTTLSQPFGLNNRGDAVGEADL